MYIEIIIYVNIITIYVIIYVRMLIKKLIYIMDRYFKHMINVKDVPTVWIYIDN